MFDLHPMRALFLMSKSGFKPPTLKDKEHWSAIFHSFVKVALTKNPKKRPNSERLLQHPFVNGGGAGTGEMSVRLMRELLHKYQNPHHLSDHDMDDEGAVGISSVPKRIPSKMLTVQRANRSNQNNHNNKYGGESSSSNSSNIMVTNNNNVNNNSNNELSPPETLPSEMSLSSYMDAQWDRMTLQHKRNCNHGQDDVSTNSTVEMKPTTSSTVTDESPKRHNSMDRLVGMFNDLGSVANRQRSLSDSEQNQPDILNNLNNTPPVPPKRKHRHRSPPFHHPVSNGLPPTPKVS